MPFHSQRKFDAATVAELRSVLPVALGSQELRGAIAEDIRARSVFCARGSNAVFLSKLKEVIDTLANGDVDFVTARWQLKECLQSLGYTPERGFPSDLSGDVPPADAGTLRDLSSDQRLDLILNTQVALMRGRGMQLRGSSEEELRAFPAWELVRVSERTAPRKWNEAGMGSQDAHGSPAIVGGAIDHRARWTIAGGTPIEGRMIALKGDPIWGELGGSGNFDDALDVDYPPFAFNSGMGWQPVPREECIRMGLRGPDRETIDEWLAQQHPLIVDTQSGLPAPQLSVKNADPAILSQFLAQTGSSIAQNVATPAANRAAILAQLDARKKARDARREARLQSSIASRIAEYAARE